MARKVFHAVKPARSYEEQARRLSQAHGLIIGDPDKARRILSTVNYYRLTTYGKHLRYEEDPEIFLPGVSLEMLYNLYQFDMGFRHLLLPVLEFVEVQLRAKIAYHLAITYGSLGYMDPDNFKTCTLSNGSLMHKNLIGKFKTEVKRQGALPFVRHHKVKYGGQFPIWAAVELFTFGMLTMLFDIMKDQDQWAVSRDYGMTPAQMHQMLLCAVDVRNICAHYNRLYNKSLDEQPILPPELREYESDRVFPLLLTFHGFCGEERVFRHLVSGLRDLKRDFPEADLSLCGFPQNWRDLLGA